MHFIGCWLGNHEVSLAGFNYRCLRGLEPKFESFSVARSLLLRFKVFFSSSPVLLQHPHNTESNASHRQTPHVQHICDDLLLLDLITGLSIAAVTLASRKYRHPHIHEPNKQNKQQIDINVSLLAHYIFS